MGFTDVYISSSSRYFLLIAQYLYELLMNFTILVKSHTASHPERLLICVHCLQEKRKHDVSKQTKNCFIERGQKWWRQLTIVGWTHFAVNWSSWNCSSRNPEPVDDVNVVSSKQSTPGFSTPQKCFSCGSTSHLQGPWQEIAMDIKGPFGKKPTKWGNRSLCFSGDGFAYSCSGNDTHSWANTIVHEVFCRHGIQSQFWQTMAVNLKTKLKAPLLTNLVLTRNAYLLSTPKPMVILRD